MIRYVKYILMLIVLCPLLAGAATVSVQVSSDNDDAEENLANGNIDRGSSDLELAYDGSTRQMSGMRFRNLAVPPNVLIVDAYVQFTVDETDSGTTNLLVSGEDIDDAPGFGTGNSNISIRSKTATVDWNSVPVWNSVGAAGVDQRTPNIASVIQTIIDRPGWSNGNDVAIFVEPGPGCTSSACQRTAESHDGVSNDAPVLVVEYIPFVPNTADVGVTIADSADPVNVNDLVNYTIVASNNGPLDATNTLVSAQIPAGATFVSAISSQGSCSLSAGTVTCSLSTLVAGTNATIFLVQQMPSTVGTLTTDVSISATETDSNSANDSDTETTTVSALNTDQLCYLVADAGGANGGDDILTVVDTANSIETAIGTGTGTFNIEAIAWRSDIGVLYAANGNRLGVLNTSSGVFFPRANTFGTGGGSQGNISLNDVDSMAWDPTTGMLFGVHARGGSNDLLFAINPASGSHIPDAFGSNVDYVELPAILGNNITDDIAVNPITGDMYASVNSGGSSDRLISIDKATGATTDIALITVPDIEGLGTDPSGQLWGSSGTQNELYEIDSSSAIGSSPRTLSVGSDYEAVDCYASSPSTQVDIGVLKVVDDSTPAPGDSIEYTITVSNSGPGSASILQISDALPAGVSFSSAVPSTGTYDSASGVWYIGNLASGNSETLAITVSVDAGTENQTITNTATLLSVHQMDTNSLNDQDSVNITVPGPDLVSLKSLLVVSDPFSGTTNPKAIPGALVQYSFLVSNQGDGATDADTVVLTDPLPAEMALRVADYSGTQTGPVLFVDGSPSSGLSYNFVSLGSTTDSVSFFRRRWRHVYLRAGTRCRRN